MGSADPHGGLSLRKCEGRVAEGHCSVRRGGHGVADPVSDGPIPSVPRLGIFDVSSAQKTVKRKTARLWGRAVRQ